MSDANPLPAGFDPDHAATGGGIFGLPTSVAEARIVVVPVPFEATVSYGDGTANGPAAVRAASRQVDLFDARTGRPYEHGIAMLDVPEQVRQWSEAARLLAAPVIAAGGADHDPALLADVAEVNVLCGRMNQWVRETCAGLLDDGKTPVVLGGDHSVPFGAFQACAERHPGMGILHIDAHYDLREAYEGFTWSHASIMWNALTRVPGIDRIVHVGIRDFGTKEHELPAELAPRSIRFLEVDVRDRLAAGRTWAGIAAEIVSQLPEQVYVSFDIDGLDPALCPGTGTPVPGGLSFHEATSLLDTLARSGRRIVGADLCEVAPADGDREWNANVGARVLYKLIGYTLLSQAPAGD